jgi:hypothetical protein
MRYCTGKKDLKIPHLMRFFDVILGALMAAPMRLLPVMKIPLQRQNRRDR